MIARGMADASDQGELIGETRDSLVGVELIEVETGLLSAQEIHGELQTAVLDRNGSLR